MTGRIAKWALAAALILFQSTAFAALTFVSRTFDAVNPYFYVDTAKGPYQNMYVAYEVVSDTNLTDAWVQIGSFTGGILGLAANESGIAHLGPMTAGVGKLALFYVYADCTAYAAGKCDFSSGGAPQQGFTVTAYDRNPQYVGAVTLGSTAATMQMYDTIAANANKVTGVTVTPLNPILGGSVTVTVTGDTGLIGAGPNGDSPLVYVPATPPDWPSNKIQLTGVSVDIPPLTNNLYSTGYTLGGTYTAVYTFKVVGTTTASAVVTPLAYIASGTQIKHTGSFSGTLDPIPPATNTLTLSSLANTLSCPINVSPAGGTTTYTLRVSNSGGEDITVDDFVDTLPSSVTYVTGSAKFNGVSISDPLINGSELIWGGSFVVPAGSSSDLTFDVTLPGTPGVYTNSAVAHIGLTQLDTTTDTADNAPASCDATVLSRPTISKSFSPTSIQPDGVSTVTLQLSNPNSIDLTNVGFTDSLPTSPGAMVVAASPNATNSCGGTVDAVAGAGSFSLSGGTITAGGSCAVTVDVTASTAGDYSNTAGGVTSNETGTTGNSSNAATLSVVLSPSLAKSFSPGEIPVNGTSVLTVTVTNPDPLTGLSSVAFTDSYPANVVNEASPAASTTCSGGTVTATAGGSGFDLSGASLPADSSCTVTVTVTSATAGVYTNTIAAGALSNTEGKTNPSAASAVLSVLDPPTVAKGFAPAEIPVNGTSVLTITLTNPNAFDITGAAFTDNYPAELVNTVSPEGATTCTGGTVTAAVDGTSLALSGATIPASGSCTVTVNVTSATAGSYLNDTGAVTTDNAGSGTSASATLTVLDPPTVAKAFTPAEIPVNGTSALTITLANPNATDITGAAFTDSYPAGLVNTATPDGATTCVGGTVTAAVDGTSLALSGATIPASGSCTVTVNVTSATAGSYLNDTGAVTTDNAGSGTSASATLTVLDPPTVAKAFTPTEIPVTGTSVLTITLTNPNATDITGAAFTDNYPAELVNMATPDGATTCTGGTVTAAVDGTSLALSGATIPASGSCTVTVNVTSATAASYLNSTGAVTTDNAGEGASASATLHVLASPVVAKAFSPSGIEANAVSVLTITLTNTNEVAITGAAFTDSYPSGLVNTGTPDGATTCAGGTVTAAADGTSLALSGGSIPASDSCTVTVNVTAASLGEYTNSTGAVTTSNAGTGSSASATLTVTELDFGDAPDSYGTLRASGGAYHVLRSGLLLGSAIDGEGDAPSGALDGTGDDATGIDDEDAIADLSGLNVGSRSYSVSVAVTNNTGSPANLYGWIDFDGNGSFEPDERATAVVATGTTDGSATLTWSNIGTVGPDIVAGNSYLRVRLTTDTLSDDDGTTSYDEASRDAAADGEVEDYPVTIGEADWGDAPDSYGTSRGANGPSHVIVAGLRMGSAVDGDSDGSPAVAGNDADGDDLSGVTPDDEDGVAGFPEIGDQDGGSSISVDVAVTNSTGSTATLYGWIDFDRDGSFQSDELVTATVPTGTSGTVQLNFTVTNDVNAGWTYARFRLTTDVLGEGAQGAASDGEVEDYRLPIVTSGYDVSGTVWEDADHDAHFDTGESGLSGVSVVLVSDPYGTPSCTATVTDTDGLYTFTAVPDGTYQIIEAQGWTGPTPCPPSEADPSGYISTTDNTLAITVAGAANDGNDFGDYHGSVVAGAVFQDDGSGGGIANNGVQDGGESGLGEVKVQATNASGTTTYATAYTAGNGRFTIYLPDTVADPVYLSETNPSAYLSVSGNVGTTGGSYDRTADTVSFTAAAGSQYSGVRFGDVPENSFVADQERSVLPGSAVFIPHTLTVRSGGDATFSLNMVANPNLSGWNALLYEDPDCDGALTSGDVQISGKSGLAAGDKVCLIVKVVAPEGIPYGAQYQVTVTAAFDYTNAAPALSWEQVVTDLVKAAQSLEEGTDLTLQKTVDKNSAFPGEVITYTITFTNQGSKPVSDVVINDMVPAYSTFTSATCGTPLPASLTVCDITAPAVGETGALKWTFTGELMPSGSGTVGYSVTVDQ